MTFYSNSTLASFANEFTVITFKHDAQSEQEKLHQQRYYENQTWSTIGTTVTSTVTPTIINEVRPIVSENSMKSWAFGQLSRFSLPIFGALKDAIQSYNSPLVEDCVLLVAEKIARVACEIENSKLLWVSDSLVDLVTPDYSNLNHQSTECGFFKGSSIDINLQVAKEKAQSLLFSNVTVTDCPDNDVPSSQIPFASASSSSTQDHNLTFDFAPHQPADPMAQLTTATYRKWHLTMETAVLYQQLFLKLNLPKLPFLSLSERVCICRDYYRMVTSSFSLKLAHSYRNRRML